MLYYNQINKKTEGLVLDGIDDYFSSNVESFNLTQPFSFFCRFVLRDRSASTLASHLLSSAIDGFYFFTGLDVFGVPANNISLTLYGASGAQGGVSTFIPLNEIINLHFVHTGGTDINNSKVYINSVEVTERRFGSVPNRTTSSNITSRTFKNSTSLARYFTGIIYNQSLVNYAKTITEIEVDNANKKQSLDLLKGSYLYNIEFNKSSTVTTFQTEETIPKTVTIYK